MKLFLPLALVAATLLGSSGGLACEKHLNSQQSNGDANTQATQK